MVMNLAKSEKKSPTKPIQTYQLLFGHVPLANNSSMFRPVFWETSPSFKNVKSENHKEW